MNRLLRAAREFLAVIGLMEESPGDYGTRLKQLRDRYFQLRDLLSANNQLLEIIADMEVRLQGDRYVGSHSVRSKALAAATSASRMVRALDALSSGRYPAVGKALERIQRRLSASLILEEVPEPDAWVVSLDRVEGAWADRVGNKMANLGEIGSRLGLPIPEGFVVTTAAYRRFLEALGGADAFQPGARGAEGPDIDAFSEGARRLILQTPVPEDLVRRIRKAHLAMATSAHLLPCLAVRSSAVEEDSSLSFAGQYLTRLNVPPEQMVDAYREVLASVYGSQAVFYRRTMGVDEEDVAMAVGFVAMVDASAAGVAYSVDPLGERPGHVVIHAVFGLGASLVDGRVEPDVYWVSRDGDSPTLDRRVARQAERVVAAPRGGTGFEALKAKEAQESCLEEKEILTLAKWAQALERHFGAPQDIEWARRRDGELVVLQSRPMTMVEREMPAEDQRLAGERPLLEGGATASPGAGSGPVFIADPEDDLAVFPEGGVLVAGHSSPKFVRAMKRASAIVTDVGSVIGHMASLSREFGVPALLGAAGATSSLKHGETVTVDASRRRVYAGRVEALLDAPRARRRPGTRSRGYHLLEKAARYVVPLSLTDPNDAHFTPLNCTTLHDIARYVHEKSFQEMFGIGRLVGDFREQAPLLDVFLPIDLYLIDLGGGLDAPQRTRRVKKAQITSPPFAALVEGMLHPDIQRFGPRAMDTRGFLHVMMRHALTNAEGNPDLRDPCYAIFSDRYLNLAARVGYHFSAVDAYCGEFINQNYISFRFKGGAADQARRVRRVRAIAEILTQRGFAAEVRNDMVVASFMKHDSGETLSRLETVGRLLQFMRQMDAAMASEAVADQVVRDFLAGNYAMDPALREAGKAGPEGP